MRYLKAGYYGISIVDKKMYYMENKILIENCSDLVKDFSAFEPLVFDLSHDEVKLVINTMPGGRSNECKFVSTKHPFIWIPAEEVIDFNKDFTFIENKEDIDMSDVKELTPEERIEQLEEEKKRLEQQIKNQKEYDKIRKGSDELFLMRQAIIDAGFTKEEAMQMILALIPSSTNRLRGW